MKLRVVSINLRLVNSGASLSVKFHADKRATLQQTAVYIQSCMGNTTDRLYNAKDLAQNGAAFGDPGSSVAVST